MYGSHNPFPDPPILVAVPLRAVTMEVRTLTVERARADVDRLRGLDGPDDAMALRRAIFLLKHKLEDRLVGSVGWCRLALVSFGSVSGDERWAQTPVA